MNEDLPPTRVTIYQGNLVKRGPAQRRSSDARQLGCVFQDVTPPKSIFSGRAQTCRNQFNVSKLTKAIARHTKIRDQNPSLGYICQSEPHQRSANAPKFGDRSQEETVWQDQGAREAAWNLAKNVQKLKEKSEAIFFSLSENRCLPAYQLLHLRKENLMSTPVRQCT